jgi:hypothetical protein
MKISVLYIQMIKNKLYWIFLVPMVCVILHGCAAKPTVQSEPESTISGRVIDSKTGQPIANATVSSEPVTEQKTTNTEGVLKLVSPIE